MHINGCNTGKCPGVKSGKCDGARDHIEGLSDKDKELDEGQGGSSAEDEEESQMEKIRDLHLDEEETEKFQLLHQCTEDMPLKMRKDPGWMI